MLFSALSCCSYEKCTVISLWKKEITARYTSTYSGKLLEQNNLPRIGESSATERQTIPSAPLPASGWDLLVPTILSDKGSSTYATPPPVQSWKNLNRWNSLLGWFWFSYISILIRFSLSHIGYYLNILV